LENKNKLLTFFAYSIATTFGTGFIPFAPGTMGSMAALIILWFLPKIAWPTLLIAILLFFFLGVRVATEAEKKWGKDAHCINWDEVVGMMIAVIFLPKTVITYVFAFVLCRFADIIKPFPANISQKLPGGWGVMTDDVIASVYSNIVTQILFRVMLKDLFS
jgi:phosphatidylglycerophosphatase A